MPIRSWRLGVAAHLGIARVGRGGGTRSRPAWRWGAIVRALRPYQWLKNALVFVPFLLSHEVGSGAKWVAAWMAFAAFSLCASAGYVVNDIIDRPQDRLHPRRRRRPIASGEAPLGVAMWMVPALLVVAACCLALPAACARRLLL